MAQSYGPHNRDRERVLEATDLVALIGEHIALKPAGREFRGLCPFHDDSNPSLHVVPHKGIYKCFACGAGGTAFDFVMNYHNMDFREALQYLAERTGITLTPPRPRTAEGGNPDASDEPDLSTADLVAAHRTAVEFYRAILRHKQHGAEARAILESRGITEAMIDRFHIGAAPDRWDGLAATLQAKKIDLTPFVKSGLLSPRRESGGYVDRFRNRIVFPIFDVLERPIAIGARKINPDDEPKYLNSPEHARFRKARTLYGLNLASRAIQSSGMAILVEGYTDVIACHQSGLTNVVAALGTALTIDHARMLQRMCSRVTLVFDGDLAGRKAADRAVEMFFAANVDVRIAILPDEQDPAELLEQDGGLVLFEKCVRTAPEAIEYLLGILSEDLQSSSTGLSGRQQIIEQFLRRLGELGYHGMSQLRRDLVLHYLSTRLNLSVASVHRLIPWPKQQRASAAPIGAQSEARRSDSARRHHAQAGGSATRQDAHAARVQAEAGLLSCILSDPAILDMQPIASDSATLRDHLQATVFEDAEYRYLLERIVKTDPSDLTPARMASWTAARPKAAQALADLHTLGIGRFGDGQIAQDTLNQVAAYLGALVELTDRASDGTDLDRDGPRPSEQTAGLNKVRVAIDKSRRTGGTRRRLGRTGTSS